MSDTTTTESLLPMENGATVLRASLTATAEGVYGTVLALWGDRNEYVTWTVYRRSGEAVYHAEVGHYFTMLDFAVRDYEKRVSGRAV
jgi:hypothetical protein